MEKRTRTKLVEIEEEYYVSTDGTEFETAEQCMKYEEMQLENSQNIYIKLLHRQNTEKRDKRMQIVVKPSTFAYLEQMQKDGKIKSKNDFINNFLEDFIQQTKK